VGGTIRRFWVAVVVLAALTALAPAPAARAAKGMEVALSDDGVFLFRAYYSRAKAFKRARELGVTRLRVMLTWAGALRGRQARSRRAPAKPRYYIHRWDDLIDAAAARGIRIQLTLTGPAPAFATSNHKIGTHNPNAKRFGRFARAMAEHFMGRVNRYSVWNEPNYVSWLFPRKRAPALYRKLYVAAYAAIKAVDPGAAVLIGETSPHDSPDRSWSPLGFLRRVACVRSDYRLDRKCAKARPAPGGTLRADGYAQHPYDFLHPPSRGADPDDVTIGSLNHLTSALDRLSRAGALYAPRRSAMPVYLTEFGYFAHGRRKIPESRHAQYLVEAFGIARRSGRVRQLLQWGLVDPPANYPGSFFNTAIMGRHGKLRKPYRSLRSWVARELKRRGIARSPKRIQLPPARPSADSPRSR
jgi:hypothetical protein